MKSIITALAIIVFSFTFVLPVFAAPLPQQIREEVREEIREEKKDNLMEKLGSAPATIINWINKRAVITRGTIASISGTSLSEATITITKDGTYTVKTDSATRFRRRFWGQVSNISEMQTGDTVTVVGRWTNNEKTELKANLIRDISIQIRHGVFLGTIQSIQGNTWSIQTKNRGNQTVTVTGATQFVNRANVSIAQSDCAVGHRVRVKGLWNRQANTITDVTQVKDFDLPSVTN
jgi:hypothetical protein